VKNVTTNLTTLKNKYHIVIFTDKFSSFVLDMPGVSKIHLREVENIESGEINLIIQE